ELDTTDCERSQHGESDGRIFFLEGLVSIWQFESPQRTEMTLRYLLLILAILTFPRTAYGGPNAGGSLILHTNPLLAYSIGTDYCNRDSLLTCDLAVTTTDLLESTIVFVVAAFPDSSEPRLQAATFGLEFDEERIDISDYGSCADF